MSRDDRSASPWTFRCPSTPDIARPVHAVYGSATVSGSPLAARDAPPRRAASHPPWPSPLQPAGGVVRARLRGGRPDVPVLPRPCTPSIRTGLLGGAPPVRERAADRPQPLDQPSAPAEGSRPSNEDRHAPDIQTLPRSSEAGFTLVEALVAMARPRRRDHRRGQPDAGGRELERGRQRVDRRDRHRVPGARAPQGHRVLRPGRRRRPRERRPSRSSGILPRRRRPRSRPHPHPLDGAARGRRRPGPVHHGEVARRRAR